MSTAFVLDGDAILCRYTHSGWQPTTLSLPEHLANTQYQKEQHRPDQHEVDAAVQNNPPYQLGFVSLFAPLPLPKKEVTTHISNDDHSTSLIADAAISTTYAQQQGLALPAVIDLAADELSLVVGHHAFVPYRQLINQLPTAISDLLSQAMQLLRWQADTQFCSRCGATVHLADSGERAMVCPHCRLRQYPRVQPCVITAITRDNPHTGETQILLAHHHRYGQQTRSLQYGLIAGFVEVGESLEHAVVREVDEEVGLAITDIRYVSSQPWPFPSNLMLGFRATYASGDIVLQEEELSHADFFDLSNLPKIPPKGSIARELIDQIATEQGVVINQ